MIDKKENVDAFACLEAQAGKEVATVLDNNHLAGKKVIVAMDTDDKTLDWIKKGAIAATVAQKPYTMGYVGIKLVDDYHHSEPHIAKMASTKGPCRRCPLTSTPARRSWTRTTSTRSSRPCSQQVIRSNNTQRSE